MYVSREIFEDLRNCLTGLIADSDALCELLLAERQALIERDSQSLQQIVDARPSKCAGIERQTLALGKTPSPEQIDSADPGAIPEFEHLHTSLLAKADQAQEYNAVNGKIVHRSQQSVRDLIHLISGMDAELLYGYQGQTMATAKGTAIAKA
jgi:flagellar biosynthesis/type III secretory pathway chaperone